ncbi:hypothetical protein M8C21_025730 [Ambrosia artemisiifolia]|uniref:Uncharacterized protein n=1 Tax=Ambrosia artemisiifolia TaxID=4212 RepID=A0AAD5GBS3_AMBAR|nr:hypothetical protein M8C21_025730 [Ambrosia artemisiifolia]
MLMVLRGNGLSKEPGRVLRSNFSAANLGFRHFSDEQIKVACLRYVWIGDPQATLDMLGLFASFAGVEVEHVPSSLLNLHRVYVFTFCTSSPNLS